MTSTSTTLDPTTASRTRGPAAPSCPRSKETARRSAPSPTSFCKIRPKYSAASTGRGSAKIGLGQFEAAIADSDQALQLQPEDPDLYYSRGIAQSVPGRFRGATVDFDQTLRLEPDDAYAYERRGFAWAGPGLGGEALADLQGLLELANGTKNSDLIASIEQRTQEFKQECRGSGARRRCCEPGSRHRRRERVFSA